MIHYKYLNQLFEPTLFNQFSDTSSLSSLISCNVIKFLSCISLLIIYLLKYLSKPQKCSSIISKWIEQRIILIPSHNITKENFASLYLLVFENVIQ